MAQRFTRRTIHRRHALAVAAAAVLGPLAATPAAAAVCTWDATNGNWNAILNWANCVAGNGNPGGTPGGNDTANIGSSGVVTIDTAQSVLNLNNAGQINLDAFTFTLVGGGGTVNSGTINVGSATTAALQVSSGHSINNAGGVINVADGSVVNQFGSTISGGTINTTGGGKLVAFNSGSNFLDGLTLNGTLDLASSTGVERVTNGLVLNGTVDIGAGSVLAPQGDQTISGTGSIVFADSSGSNRLNVEAGNLTLGGGITVHGNTGIIGQQAYVGGAATLTNNGTISADGGGTITLGVSGAVTNFGTLSAAGAGSVLLLNSSIANKAGSQILATGGGKVIQNGVTLNGVVNVTSGAMGVANSGSNFFDDVSFSGALDLASSTGVERVTNGLVLNGTVNIGAGSVLAPQGDQTISGTGSIVFADSSGSNRLNVEAGNLTLGSGITVRGNTGYIGQQAFVGGAATLTNNGAIQADVAGGNVTINVSGLTTNNGVLAAKNGGTLWLASNVHNGGGGQILADTGSTVVQSGITLDGDIHVVGSGNFVATNSGSNFLNGASFSGALDLASSTGVERVTNGLVLNGTVNIGAGSVLAPQGDQTISGTGSIVFADSSGSNRLNVEAGNLTLGSGITVRGNTGYIGQQAFVGGAATLINQGLISADVSGGTITVNVTSGVVNQGTMQAKNGGTLLLNGNGPGVANSGVLLADAGSTVVFNGVNVSGGALNGSGRFVGTNNGSNFLNGTTLNGTLDLASSTGVERVTGGMTVNGAVNIGAGSVLAPQGDQTISGTGSIVFADNNGSNRLNVEAGNLTLGNGITVHGNTGYIGQQAFVGGAATLTNNGTINADGGGTITVAVNGVTTNNGMMRAQNGTLDVNTALVNNGTLRADADGVVNLPTNFANDGLMTGVGKFALSGTLTNNGHMRPGTPGGEPGALTLDGKYAQGSLGWFDVGLDGANFGSLAVSGSAALDGTIGVICEGMCDYAVGTSWIVMTTGGNNLVSGTFAGPVMMSGFSEGAFTVTYLSNQVILNVTEATVGVVPEPGTVALMLAGIAAVGFVARRRNAA